MMVERKFWDSDITAHCKHCGRPAWAHEFVCTGYLYPALACRPEAVVDRSLWPDRKTSVPRNEERK